MRSLAVEQTATYNPPDIQMSAQSAPPADKGQVGLSGMSHGYRGGQENSTNY